MARNEKTFKAGQERTPGSGRQKGTSNRRTLALQNQLEELNVDPVGTLAKILLEQMEFFEMHKKKKQIASAASRLTEAEKTVSNLMQYLFPKKKAIEHSGEVNLFSFADFMALAKSGKK